MAQVKAQEDQMIIAAIRDAIADLVSVKRVGPSRFVSLPLLYPDGSFVTIKIDPMGHGIRVSDCGFAYRKVEAIGAEASFERTAKGIAEQAGVNVGQRAISVDVHLSRLTRAICDVSMASWQVADTIYGRYSEATSG